MRIAIIGRGEVLYDTCIALRDAGHTICCVLTAKEAPEYTRTSDDFRSIAKELGAPFAMGGKISSHFNFFKSVQADIGVSINYTGVIPQSVIDLFPVGILNAHGGDLPRYRGNACQAWALINGEEKIGLCIHKMIGGELDSGDIIARDYFSATYSTTITEVWHWMACRTPELIMQSVESLQLNPNYFLEKQSKDPADALRCYPRSPEDGRIDWRCQAIEILRLINASNKPFSGAYCYFEGKKLIIWDAELVEDKEIFLAVPGQVTKFESKFAEIACGSGKLRILRVQLGDEVSLPSKILNSVRMRLN